MVNEKQKQVPTGVKVISVMYYIGAVLGVIFGLLFLFGAGMMGSLTEQIPLLGLFGAGLFVVGGIIMIGLGVLGFFVGRNLGRVKPWARIVAIIFAGLGILTAVSFMIQGDIAGNILGLALNLAIGGYLLLNSRVKEVFA
ncbi:hypothetical protein HY494_00875 [Candidatus Woesearchaeota archaeon]|nr:hypothetical protein [Candidatus Woesearchaeota archaeon]